MLDILTMSSSFHAHRNSRTVLFLRQTRSHLTPVACIPKKKQQQKRQKSKTKQSKATQKQAHKQKRSQI
jgi:hypothetical protein